MRFSTGRTFREFAQLRQLRVAKMLLVDTRTGRLLEDSALKHRYAAENPYGEWLDQELLQLADIPIPNRKVPEYTA